MFDMKLQHEVRPLCWWSPAQLSQFARFVRPVWEQWLDDWVVNTLSTSRAVDCSPACENPGLLERAWMSLGTSERAAAWLDPVQASAFSPDILFGSPAGSRRSPNDSIAAVLLREAHADLCRALCARLGLAPSDDSVRPQADVFRPWIGGLLVSLGSKGVVQGLNLLADAQTVGRVLAMESRHEPSAEELAQGGPRGGLYSVESMLAGKPVQLRVRLATCELDLGALSSLRVGDIVPLPHALDDPLTVALHDRPFCAGYLGRRNGAKAIELTHADGAKPITEHNTQGNT